MNNDQRMILQQIINCDKTAEKIALVNENRNLLGNVQIVLFDENVSNFRGFWHDGGYYASPLMYICN